MYIYINLNGIHQTGCKKNSSNYNLLVFKSLSHLVVWHSNGVAKAVRQLDMSPESYGDLS